MLIKIYWYILSDVFNEEGNAGSSNTTVTNTDGNVCLYSTQPGALGFKPLLNECVNVITGVNV